MSKQNRMAELRKAKGVSLSDFARMIGVDKAEASRYEAGGRFKIIEKAIAIAKYYEVTLDYLFNVTEINLYNSNVLQERVEEIKADETYKSMIQKQTIELVNQLGDDDCLKIQRLIVAMIKNNEMLEKELEKLKNGTNN